MSGSKRTGMPPKEWAKHLRPLGKKQFWSSVRCIFRSEEKDKWPDNEYGKSNTVSRINDIRPKDMRENARLMAKQYLSNIKRTGNVATDFDHSCRVADIVSFISDDDDIWCGAMLHDIIEGSEVSVEDIAFHFNRNVANIVDGLTDEYTKVKYPSLSRMERKKLEVSRLASASPDIQTVKLADALSKIEEIKYLDIEFALVYYQELKNLSIRLTDGNAVLRKDLKEKLSEMKLVHKSQVKIDDVF